MLAHPPAFFLGLPQIPHFTVRFKTFIFFHRCFSPVVAFSAFLVALAFNPFNG
jgi:hypothetical protein